MPSREARYSPAMAVLTVTSETNVILTKGQATEIIPARAGRRAVAFQVQFQGPGVLAFGWCKLSGVANVDDGFEFVAREVTSIGGGIPGGKNETDFYEGPVSVYWEGRRNNPASEPLTVNCRIVEIS